eukprot:1194759-Prorocentrum_minimum.AAC.5
MFQVRMVRGNVRMMVRGYVRMVSGYAMCGWPTCWCERFAAAAASSRTCSCPLSADLECFAASSSCGCAGVANGGRAYGNMLRARPTGDEAKDGGSVQDRGRS